MNREVYWKGKNSVLIIKVYFLSVGLGSVTFYRRILYSEKIHYLLQTNKVQDVFRFRSSLYNGATLAVFFIFSHKIFLDLL